MTQFCENCENRCPIINDKCDGCKEIVKNCSCRLYCSGTPYEKWPSSSSSSSSKSSYSSSSGRGHSPGGRGTR